MSIDVMKQALEYLDSPSSKLWPAGTQYNIITALRLAIEQAERQEPDGYGYARRLAEAIWQKHYKAVAPQWKPLDDLMGVLTQIDNMTSGLIARQDKQEPVAWEPIELHVLHSHIAGVLFDFMGWLTSRRERLTLSSADEAGPAVEAITKFAKMRGLRLEDAQVEHWQAILTAPPQRQPLTEGEIVACIDDVFAWALDDGNIDDSHVIRFTRAIERAHGIGGGE
jgi:hypothetical protein